MKRNKLFFWEGRGGRFLKVRFSPMKIFGEFIKGIVDASLLMTLITGF